MAVSVRMDPLLERQLEQAAKRQGVTKSRFIVAAVERALGHKNPYELMLALKAEEKAPEYRAVTKAYAGEERAYTPARRARQSSANSRPNMTAALVDAGPMVALFGTRQPHTTSTCSGTPKNSNGRCPPPGPAWSRPGTCSRYPSASPSCAGWVPEPSPCSL